MSEEKTGDVGGASEVAWDSAIGTVLGMEMPKLVRRDALELASMLSRYRGVRGARALLNALAVAYTELGGISTSDLIYGRREDGFTAEGDVPGEPPLPPDDGRLRIRAKEEAGVLLSELLVGGAFVRTEQSARQAFRQSLVKLDGAIVGVDQRLKPGEHRLKVGDQDERIVEIAPA